MTIARRPYLSYTQLTLWEKDPKEYYRRYILGEKQEGNKYMDFGKKLAEALESGLPAEDAGIEHLRTFLPNFAEREYKIEADCMGVPILAILDGFNPKRLEIDEVKTGKLWTQKRVDTDDQLTFYSLICYLKYKKQPKAMRLHWARTIENKEGEIKATGEIKLFVTSRTISQQLDMANRIKRAWKAIKKLK